MAKEAFKTVPLLDGIAAIVACEDHRTLVARAIKPDFDPADHKPSASVYVNNYDNKTGETHSDEIPAVTDYAKTTLGLNDKWTSNIAVTVVVTDEHRKLAEQYIKIINNKIMMMILQGAKVNGFVANLGKKLEQKEISKRDLGLLTYVPKTARQYEERSKLDEKKASYSNSIALGVEGQKINAEITIFNSREMTQYDSILYEAHDAHGNLITFFKNAASKAQFEVGETYSINGKIKKADKCDYSYGAIVNTLNYVRLNK